MSSPSPSPEPAAWECGWSDHDRAQLLRLAALPLAEKLAWLEEAQRLAARLESSRRRLSPGDCGGPRGGR